MIQSVAQSLHKLRYPGCKKKWLSKEKYLDSTLRVPTHKIPMFNEEKSGTWLQHLLGKILASLHKRERFQDSSSKFRVQSLHQEELLSLKEIRVVQYVGPGMRA